MIYSSIIRGVLTKGRTKNTKLTGLSGLGFVVVGSLFHFLCILLSFVIRVTYYPLIVVQSYSLKYYKNKRFENLRDIQTTYEYVSL